MNIEKIAQELDFDIEDVQMLLGVFIKTAKESVGKIYTAIEEDDFDTISKSAHSIKGSAANLLLEDIAKDALYIEKSAKNKESILSQMSPQKIMEQGRGFI